MLFCEKILFYFLLVHSLLSFTFSTSGHFMSCQVEVARTNASEESAKMYDRVQKARDDSKSLDESLKGLTKELQTLNKEKETVEARQTKAIKKKTKLDLDVRDFQDRIAGNIQSKVLLTWWLHSQYAFKVTYFI